MHTRIETHFPLNCDTKNNVRIISLINKYIGIITMIKGEFCGEKKGMWYSLLV